MITARRSPVFAAGLSFALLLAIVFGMVTSNAQGVGPTGLVAGRSVNMVAGDGWPTGDPFLQRQNEPSVAASTRNPQHLLAGANDYRTVDLPGLSTGPETGDAWLGLFKSFDGGERWQSTLLPGYPQDTSPEGMASPLKGFEAGADAVVRPGTNGLLYYAGLAFNRGENKPSAVFMSRFIDNNNKENGDPIGYIGTTIIDYSNGTDFIDKPWMAVDIPRAGAKTCKIVMTEPGQIVKPGTGWGRFSGWKKREAEKKAKNPTASPKATKAPKPIVQSILAGDIYVAYSRIKTVGTALESKIMFSRSEDCGVTWSKPQQISNPEDKINQGATLAIDPRTGGVSVAWRQFGVNITDTDSILVARQPVKAKAFEKAIRVHKFNAKRPADRLRKMIAEHQMGDADEVSEIQPFDQGTAEDRFRTNAYPTITIDDESRAYLAWTQRGFGVARPGTADGDARVVIATSRGAGWTTPRAVDTGAAGNDLPGHQLMPSIVFSQGRLVIAYYDLREDVSQVFGPFIDENDAVITVRKRHTIDLRAAYATKGDVPVFGASTKVSAYAMGSRPGSTTVEQMQFNAPALPLFKLGTVPFMGDYIDLAPAPMFVQGTGGTWKYNTDTAAAPVFHAVWTDNRDVRPPRDGNWANYTPVGLPGAASKFDPSQQTPSCQAGQTGMRNQNIYSARLTMGLIAGSPGNTKPLSLNTPRSFVVFAQNTTTAVQSYRFTIASQPVGGVASFTQSAAAGGPYPLTTVDVSVAPKSMVTRSVFITSSDPKAQVPVDIQQISAPTEGIVSGGLASRVVLNPDISNPDISNPDISNPDISNPDISNAEVYNPDISNPDISNPDISNPDISNPDISNPDISNVRVANPDISNPDISNPDISNPDISNPDISNPDISNPDISNGALTDVTWTIINTGNTTASFNVNLFLANAAAKLGGVKTQLVVHKTYSTPIASDCELKQQTQTVLVANVPNPVFLAPGTATEFDPANSAVTNTTIWLEPGGEGKITLRIVDPNPKDNVTINPVRDVTPVVTAEPVNTEDIGTPNPEPPATAPPTAPDVQLAFFTQPVSSILSPASLLTRMLMPAVQAQVRIGVAPAPGVQVTVAIANNPSGGHLSGTMTVLSDANGIATFNDLSIEKTGVGYQFSVSASASGAVPDLSVPFDIVRATATALATGAGPVVYDALAHPGTCAVTGMFGEPLGGVISYSSGGAPVNAGNHTVTCSYAGSEFYDAASHNAAITITPAPSTTLVTCPASVGYDGDGHQPCTATATGVGGLNQPVSVTYTNNVNAGTATADAAYAGDANHSSSSDSETFTITPAPSTTLVTCPASVTYNGQAQSACSASATGAGGLNQAVPVTYANNTNVGTATADATFGGDANHTGSTDSETFAITPATPMAIATGGAFAYDGSPHPGTCAFNGVNGEVLTGAISWSSVTAPVNPGNYTVFCNYAASSNYTAAASSAAISIALPAGSFVVTTTNDSMTLGTLRFAINAANTSGDNNTITFAIPPGPMTITLGSQLPSLSTPMVIDATTQAGYDGLPVVQVNAGTTVGRAFNVTAPGTVKGLMITGFDGANGHGVWLRVGSNGSIVEDNVIGTDRTGSAGLGNERGIVVQGVDNAIVRRNVLSGNVIVGLVLDSGANALVQDNRIGTTPDGLSARPNGTGVVVDNASLGPVIRSNTISGNNGRGIDVRNNGGAVSGVRVIANTIGLGVDGTTRISNRTGGILLTGTEGAIIGEPNFGNVISGTGVFNLATTNPGQECDTLFSGNGITVSGVSAAIPVIQSNLIGTDATGEVAVANLFGGIALNAPAKVGGSGPDEGNVIAGNGCAPSSGAGIILSATMTAGGTVIQGNTIGLSKTTSSVMGNGYSGITVNSTVPALIGGSAPGEGNLISGNPYAGIAIYSIGSNPPASNVTIHGNKIGTAADGVTAKPNGFHGVLAEGTAIDVGGIGQGQGNVIAGNGAAGVVVQTAGSRAAVLGNVIRANGTVGIELVGGGNVNDAGDTDAGPNGFQNFPVINNADNSGAVTSINISLNSAAGATYTVEVFANAACDASGRGEGDRLVGRFVLGTDGAGNNTSNLLLTELVPAGQLLSATATDGAGNTSEFSTCRVVPNPAQITSVTPSNGMPGEGFLVVRGSNLPLDLALVTNGPTTGNGFVFGFPSSSTAVWVRLPVGQPLGASTIQLKNAAGTVVSNAFPITVTPQPGTPVITGVYDELAVPISAPVPASSKILVAADGIDTSFAVVRFTQGASTWDVPEESSQAGTMGVAALVTVPAGAAAGPINVSIRQGGSAFSAPVAITVAAPPVSPYVVTNTTDGGLGSLRFAITSANANPDNNTITFAIPGPGPHTIALGSQLAAITQPLVVDGTSQPGYDGNPMITISGAGTGARGFELQSPATIRGVSLIRFTTQPAVLVMNGGGGSIIEVSHIGTDRSGASGLGNQIGVRFNYTNNAIVRNSLISGNAIDGVLVTGGSANEIRSNFIGTGLSGLGSLANGDNGITLYDGANNTVIFGNIISGNGTVGGLDPGWGIDIQQSGALAEVTNTRITGNSIGLDAAGNVISRGGADYVGPGPGFTNFGPVNRGNIGGGIRVIKGPGTIIGSEVEAKNTISGNAGPGVQIIGFMTVKPVLKNNLIGLDPSGNNARANGGRGVEVLGSMALIGTAVSGNTISGNIRDGVYADGNTRIENNRIGTNASGNAAVGNGMLDDGGTPFSPGCCHTGVFVLAPGNVVKGNLLSGNRIAGVRSGGALGQMPNEITNNLVGSDAGGTFGIPNGEGIGLYGDKSGTLVMSNLIQFNNGAAVRLVEGTQNAQIGGLGAGEGNTIRNNTSAIQVGYNLGATGDINNRIFSNIVSGSGLAIDLGSDAQTPNDGGSGNYDTDIGPNNLQNTPTMNMAANLLGQSNTLVDFNPFLAAGTYTIQFFSGADCTRADAVVSTLTLNFNGFVERRVVDLGVQVPAGLRLFMTATDSAGNTSEFKSCATVTTESIAYSATTGHYYQYVTNPLQSWNDANNAATTATFAGLAGHLVSITSASEQSTVHSLYSLMGLGDMRAWIGLIDNSGTGSWGWTTGEPFFFNNWGGGEPNNIGSERWTEFFASGSWNNNVSPNFAIQGYVIEYQ